MAMTQAQDENVNQGGHTPKCNRCNMFHFGKAPCGDPNHLANSELCPEKKKQEGRNASGHIYAVKDVDQAQGPNVVTEIQLDDKLHFIEEPVEIMDREVKQLKQSRIPIVKIIMANVPSNDPNVDAPANVPAPANLENEPVDEGPGRDPEEDRKRSGEEGPVGGSRHEDRRTQSYH
ncbi:hypothetical protein Tco_0025323 [Tanacetum coccineum]